MSPAILRTQSNERLDLTDFQYLAEDLVDAAQRQPGQSWMTAAAQRTWIMNGFATTNPSGTVVSVARGVALLARRDGGDVLYGVVAAEGDASRAVDLNAYADGTYQVYVRFEYVDSALQSRIFWNPSGTGSEFAQTMNTRYAAEWSMRVEAGSPGAEWTRIAQVVKSGGGLVLTDLRQFYFEGAVAGAYPLDWGAGTNDRSDNRAAYGVGDLRTWSSAVRTRLTELGGQQWWKQNLDGTGVIAKADEADFFVNGGHVSGYAATNPAGLTIRVTSGVAYVTGRRIAISNATPLGYIDLTQPAAATRYVELLNTGVLQLSAAPTGLTLWQIVSAGGVVTQVNDFRGRVPRRYNGQLVLQNAQSLAWMNSSDATDGELYLDASNALIQNMGNGGDMQWWTNNHGNRIMGLTGSDAGNTQLDLVSPVAVILHFGETSVADWYTMMDGGTLLWRKGSTAATDNVMALFTGGASPDTATTWQLYSDLPSGGGTNDWFGRMFANASGEAHMQLKNSYTGFDPIYRAVVRDTANYWEWRVDTSDDDALNWRTSGGTWLYGAHGTGNLGIRRLVVGNVSNGATTGIDYLLTDSDLQFCVQTSADSADPMVRFIRSTDPDNSGSIDFVVSNTAQNRIMSRAKALYTGTIAAVHWYLLTANTERLRVDSTGHLYTNAHAASAGGHLEVGGLLLEGATTGNEAMLMLTDSAGVAHGMTTYADTDCYLDLSAHGASAGGARLRGFGEGARGTQIEGYATTSDTTTSSTDAAIRLVVGKKSGTSATAFAAADNIFMVSNLTTSEFVVKGDGTTYVQTNGTGGAVSTFDDQQDALACHDLAYAMAGRWNDVWAYGAERLQKMGVMDGTFLNLQNGLAMGLSGVSEMFQVLDWVLRNKLGLSYEEIRQQVRATA